MEGSSSPPSDSNQTASGASEFLRNLPSRGLLSSTVFSSNPGGMRVYVCCHDTAPPEGQQIQTNQQNILIRSLTLKKPKRESSSKDVKVASAAEGSTPEGSRKRAAERVLDSRASAKRAVGQTSSRQEGSSSQASSRDFQGLTVERLRALLKAKGLSLKGKKDELVARLKSSSS